MEDEKNIKIVFKSKKEEEEFREMLKEGKKILTGIKRKV